MISEVDGVIVEIGIKGMEMWKRDMGMGESN